MSVIRLFDIQNGQVMATEHCFTCKSLREIMQEYPMEYLKIYAYLFYMTCPNPELNPFFNIPELDKEDLILAEVQGDFSTEDELVLKGLAFCEKCYNTPTARIHRGFKIMIDRLADYMATTPVEHGRDGNITALVNAAKNFDGIRQSFKGVAKDLMEEQQAIVRGGQDLAYDQ
jgi:hypothetical protein